VVFLGRSVNRNEALRRRRNTTEDIVTFFSSPQVPSIVRFLS
jgi:hypothetical protein